MRNNLYNWSVFVDGRGHVGEAKSITPPKLVMKIEEMMGGGMMTPVDLHLGTEKLECSITWNGQRPQSYRMFGLAPGVVIPITCHQLLTDVSGPNQTRVTIHMRGFLRELDPGEAETQSPTNQKDEFSLNYYRRLENGVEVLEIDALLGTIRVNGVETTASVREALMY